MQSTDNEKATNASSSGKTSRGYSQQKIMLSDVFSGLWQGADIHLNQDERQMQDEARSGGDGTKPQNGTSPSGQTLVLCLDPKEQSRGGPSMLNISDWPNDASVCLLSQVLETDLIPDKYYLSPKACAGILRRAAKRSKKLPEALEIVLKEQAKGHTGTV